MKLIEQVQLGDITTAQYEQLMGFLDAERLGLTERIYSPETARRRRKLAASLGIAPADAELDGLDVSLDEILGGSPLGLGSVGPARAGTVAERRPPPAAPLVSTPPRNHSSIAQSLRGLCNTPDSGQICG